jgi:hypothetical protein
VTPPPNSYRLLDPSPEKGALRRRQLKALLIPQHGTFTLEGGRSPDDPPLCLSATDPQSPDDPEQSSSLNKKERTSSPLALLPTEKQQTCPRPAPAIVVLPDNIRICHHCYGLLDETLKLIPAEQFFLESGEAEHRALPECEVRQLADEPEGKHQEVGQASAAA